MRVRCRWISVIHLPLHTLVHTTLAWLGRGPGSKTSLPSALLLRWALGVWKETSGSLLEPVLLRAFSVGGKEGAGRTPSASLDPGQPWLVDRP